MEAIQAFDRIHFAKVKLNKDEKEYNVIDNYNVLSFTAAIPEKDTRCLTVNTSESSTSLFHIVQNSDEEFSLKSLSGDDIGFVAIESSEEVGGPTNVQVLSPDNQVRFKITRFPLIEKTNEFHVVSTETMGVVGRINVARAKAIVSLQPELEGIHKVRIVSVSMILLGMYNKCWL